MKITIFGATGMVGKELVQQALLNGDKVVAFGRNVFSAGFTEEDQLTLFQGVLFDAGEVLHAIKGVDAVISVIGGAVDGTDKSRSLGMKNIVEQMQKAGVNKIVALGGLGILEGADGKLLLEDEDYPAEYYAVGQEHKKAYEYLKASSLNWTFVCSPDIKNEAATGMFHTSADVPPTPNHYRIAAGDLALFMLREIKKNEYPHKRVGISN
ncbi:MAG: NAD(P)H-binding protein [Ferruginibacter sp.]